MYIVKVAYLTSMQKTNIMASGPIPSWQIDGETIESDTLYFWGLQNYCKWQLAAMILKDACSLEEKL